MYNDFYDTTTIQGASIDSNWLIISAILAIVGGITAYVMFVSQKKEKKISGFVDWLHDFLNFKNFFIEIILKVLYLITAIYITLGSFSFIRTSVASFFLMLIIGNIIARVSYEMLLMLITIVKNTTEINEKLNYIKKDEEKIVSKTKKKIENEVE